MSDLLRLAAELRALPDATLAAALLRRQISPANARDFFDLGEQLLSTRQLQATIASLPKSRLDALAHLTPGPALDELHELLLVFRDGERWRSYDAVSEVLATLWVAKRSPKQKPALVVASELAAASTASAEALGLTTGQRINQTEIDRDCAIAIFETVQALTELVFYVEQHLVRVVGRGGVGLPDLKRLAARLNKSTDYAREIFDLARTAGLTVLTAASTDAETDAKANGQARWELGAQAQTWIDAQPIERWTQLARVWRAGLGDSVAADLIGQLSLEHENSLDDLLGEYFPLADSNVAANLRRTISYGNLIGITDSGWLSSWAPAVLKGDQTSSAELVLDRMPATSERLIVQADSTMVAPGPLPTNIELQVREFADCEQIGFASSYRISTLSITLGMELGLHADDIRSLLVRLSGKDLPQPVEYLLREAKERFGRLVVHTASVPEHSVVTSNDPILLKGILNDPTMKPYGLVETSNGDIACQFEAEVLYFGLREAGYAAVRAESLSATRATESAGPLHLGGGATRAGGGQAAQARSTASALDPLAATEAQIARIREQDARAGVAPDADDVARQIQLAIKNRTRLLITIQNGQGESIEYLLEPVGIANGRLRAKDRKADIERTLPLSSITQVSLA